jgi:hypothetical protein
MSNSCTLLVLDETLLGRGEKAVDCLNCVGLSALCRQPHMKTRSGGDCSAGMPGTGASQVVGQCMQG